MDDNTLHVSGRKVLLMGPYLFLNIQCAFYSRGKQDFLQSTTGRASFTTAWSRQRLPLKLAVPSWLFLGCWGWNRKPRACWVSTIPGTTSLAPRLVFSRPRLSLGRCLTLIEQKKSSFVPSDYKITCSVSGFKSVLPTPNNKIILRALHPIESQLLKNLTIYFLHL